MRLDLDGLAAASREALMAEWREVVGRHLPKHLSKPLMVQILSHAYQLDTVGGYSKRLDSRLKTAARRDVVRPAFKRCCQTNEPKHQYSFDEFFYGVTKERHSVRAASRFSLNVLRFESDLCELNRL